MARDREAKRTTTALVQRGDFTGAAPEFGRTPDVTRTFGLRRGTLYNLAADGKIRGVLLRSRGQKSGCRLWDMESIRRYIHQCGAKQESA
jgi:hypothetical protein